MGSPTHHVPGDRLVEYATGACGEPAALAIATHASLCATCAEELRVLDAVGGALLEELPREAPPPGALERLLAALDGQAPRTAIPAVEPDPGSLLAPLGVPRAVWPYLEAGTTAKGWRRLVPGIARLDLRVGAPSVVARIVRLRPGLEIPLHDHGGDEYTVIFTGALADDEGRFARGDVSIRPAGARHVQRVEQGEPCVALVINEGPLLPLTLKGRVLARLARR
jgi:putative transcriptional regulator